MSGAHRSRISRPLSAAIACLSLVVALCSSLSLSGAAAAAGGEPLQAQLLAKARASLEAGYRRLIDPGVDPVSLGLIPGSARNGTEATVATRVAAIDARRSGNATYGLHFTSSRVVLLNPTVERPTSQILLRVTEQVWLRFEVGGRGPRASDEMAEEVPHVLRFEVARGGAYTLVFDEVEWPVAPQPSPDPAVPLDHVVPLALHPVGNARGGAKPLARPLGAWGTFNASAAVSYATTYWSSYNSYYRTYPNDCTNFMSQTLAAGAWTAKGGYYMDPNVSNPLPGVSARGLGTLLVTVNGGDAEQRFQLLSALDALLPS